MSFKPCGFTHSNYKTAFNGEAEVNGLRKEVGDERKTQEVGERLQLSCSLHVASLSKNVESFFIITYKLC